MKRKILAIAFALAFVLFTGKNVLAAGVIISPSDATASLIKGSSISYSISLDSQPTADVQVAINHDSKISSSQSALVFTSSTWNVSQNFNLSAVDDHVLNGPQVSTVSYSVSSDDGAFSGLSIPSLEVTITDNSGTASGFSFISPTPANGATINSDSQEIKIRGNQNLSDATINFGLNNGDFESGNLSGWTVGPSGDSWQSNTSAHSGSYSAKASSVNGSWIKRTVNFSMDTTIYFWWKATGISSVTFYIDDVSVASNVGTFYSGWVERSISIPSGSHELKWSFNKANLPDVFGNQSSFAYIDDVRFGTVNGTYSMSLNSDTGSYQLTGLSDGPIIYNISATDSLGNGTTTPWRIFTVDVSAPIAVLSNKPVNNTTSQTASITVGGTDVYFYRYKLDSNDYGDTYDVSQPIVLSGLSQSSHTLKVIGTDNNSNWQADADATSYTWNISAPAVSSGGGGGGGGGGGSLYSTPVTESTSTVASTSTIAVSTTTAETVTTTPQVAPQIIVSPTGQVLGVKIYANGSWLRATGTSQVYVLDHGMRKLLTAKQVKANKKAKVFVVDSSVLANYPNYRADNTLIRSAANNKVYVVKGGKKYYISSLKELKKYRGKKLYNLGDNEIDLFPNG